ncbi:unnamed protein product [Lactuca saligna]|uniref:Endopeptidase Clp n=1 Tax=Lactuca saligna TaxID=75948 RepID=A0AA35VLU9_LACSI|nr:unnamed protein product [Lactuca saligna]
MPLGTAIHNIEITLGKGGQLARAAGAVAKLIAKEGKSATLKLPSGEVRLISKNCSATVGQVGNVGVALYDTMQFVQPDVHTICMGSAASMGSFILVGGEITKRLAFPHAWRQ